MACAGVRTLFDRFKPNIVARSLGVDDDAFGDIALERLLEVAMLFGREQGCPKMRTERFGGMRAVAGGAEASVDEFPGAFVEVGAVLNFGADGVVGSREYLALSPGEDLPSCHLAIRREIVGEFFAQGHECALFGLLMEEFGVEAIEFEELLMCAVFGDDAVVDNGDFMASHGHGDALRDHDGGFADEDMRERFLDFLFCGGVECGGAVVEDEEFGVGEECSRE